MNTNKYLPLGTVVLLKGGKKRLMITGFCVTAQDADGKMFDYSGCLYPEGMISSDKNCLFNHEQIEKIYFMGYSDEEDKQFKTKLMEFINSKDKK